MMFSAKRLPSGNWRVQLDERDVNGKVVKGENGKRKRVSITAPTKYEAIRKACEYVGEKHIPKEEECQEPQTDMTFHEALWQYINDSEGVLSSSTLKGDRTIARTRLLLIKDIPLKKLKPVDVQRAVNADRQRGLGYKSVKEALGRLSRICNLYDIKLNLRHITNPKDQKIKKPLPPVSELLPLVLNTDIEVPSLLAMWCSLRVSEVRGLKYSDISTVNGQHYITVHRTKKALDHGDVVEDKTKNETSMRINMLPEYLYNKIMALPHNSDDEFIVKGCYNSLREKVKDIMENHGYNDITFHTFRHEFATTLNDLGISGEYIQKLGGWANPVIVNSIYTHTINEREKEYQTRINEHFESIIRNARTAE